MLEIAFKASQQKVNVIRKVLIIIITYVSISLDMLIIFVTPELLGEEGKEEKTNTPGHPTLLS